MNRNKLKINLIKLSWENEKLIHYCDVKNCNQEGKYKAPKSKLNIHDYYFFCLKHVKEYNKSWDYYKGMSVDQIECSLRNDVIWNRPSWPTRGTPKKIMETLDSILNNNFNFFKKDNNFHPNTNNGLDGQHHTLEIQQSIKKLEIKIPITLEKIKTSYKKLVKKYHPDLNKDDKNAEKNFKEVNEAYKTLLKKILKK